MNEIKTSILTREVMDKNFLIIDSSLPLINCVKKMSNKYEACLVVKDGNFFGVLGKDDILRGFMYSKNKDTRIEDIKIKKNFEVVNPRTDIYETLLLMKKNDVDFIVVKDSKKFIGLITKREITEIEPLLFENLNRTT